MVEKSSIHQARQANLSFTGKMPVALQPSLSIRCASKARKHRKIASKSSKKWQSRQLSLRKTPQSKSTKLSSNLIAPLLSLDAKEAAIWENGKSSSESEPLARYRKAQAMPTAQQLETLMKQYGYTGDSGKLLEKTGETRAVQIKEQMIKLQKKAGGQALPFGAQEYIDSYMGVLEAQFGDLAGDDERLDDFLLTQLGPVMRDMKHIAKLPARRSSTRPGQFEVSYEGVTARGASPEFAREKLKDKLSRQRLDSSTDAIIDSIRDQIITPEQHGHLAQVWAQATGSEESRCRTEEVLGKLGTSLAAVSVFLTERMDDTANFVLPMAAFGQMGDISPLAGLSLDAAMIGCVAIAIMSTVNAVHAYQQSRDLMLLADSLGDEGAVAEQERIRSLAEGVQRQAWGNVVAASGALVAGSLASSSGLIGVLAAAESVAAVAAPFLGMAAAGVGVLMAGIGCGLNVRNIAKSAKTKTSAKKLAGEINETTGRRWGADYEMATAFGVLHLAIDRENQKIRSNLFGFGANSLALIAASCAIAAALGAGSAGAGTVAIAGAATIFLAARYGYLRHKKLQHKNIQRYLNERGHFSRTEEGLLISLYYMLKAEELGIELEAQKYQAEGKKAGIKNRPFLHICENVIGVRASELMRMLRPIAEDPRVREMFREERSETACMIADLELREEASQRLAKELQVGKKVSYEGDPVLRHREQLEQDLTPIWKTIIGGQAAPKGSQRGWHQLMDPLTFDQHFAPHFLRLSENSFPGVAALVQRYIDTEEKEIVFYKDLLTEFDKLPGDGEENVGYKAFSHVLRSLAPQYLPGQVKTWRRLHHLEHKVIRLEHKERKYAERLESRSQRSGRERQSLERVTAELQRVRDLIQSARKIKNPEQRIHALELAEQVLLSDVKGLEDKNLAMVMKIIEQADALEETAKEQQVERKQQFDRLAVEFKKKRQSLALLQEELGLVKELSGDRKGKLRALRRQRFRLADQQEELEDQWTIYRIAENTTRKQLARVRKDLEAARKKQESIYAKEAEHSSAISQKENLSPTLTVKDSGFLKELVTKVQRTRGRLAHMDTALRQAQLQLERVQKQREQLSSFSLDQLRTRLLNQEMALEDAETKLQGCQSDLETSALCLVEAEKKRLGAQDASKLIKREVDVLTAERKLPEQRKALEAAQHKVDQVKSDLELLRKLQGDKGTDLAQLQEELSGKAEQLAKSARKFQKHKDRLKSEYRMAIRNATKEGAIIKE